MAIALRRVAVAGALRRAAPRRGWFALLEQKALKRGVHRSTIELEKAIYELIEVSNEDPRPYLWTKSADDILANLQRFCGRTLATQGVLANF